MNCKNCGSIVRENARFCGVCGTAQDKRSGPCPYCGNPVSQGMKFCRFCGNSIENIFCPLCQRPNRLNVKFCAHCGAQMLIPSISDPFGTGRLPVGVVLNGRYMIVRKIAQGGMGAVYEAKEVPTSPTSRRLAIKEMSFSMLDQIQEDKRKAVVDSFHREYDLLRKLDHPNLVRAFEFFEESGRQFFVMEYIEGRTLESLLDNLAPGEFFPMDRVLAWAHQLCTALFYLHSQIPPIIYRDLKPSNIMEVTGSNLVKLFDFGIARYYKPGQRTDTVRFGTDGYLAPEIIAYQTQTSKQTDIFALGAVLHQILTRYDPQIDPWRRPPIRNLNPFVPERVMSAIDRALAFNPISRTQDANALLKDLFGEKAEIEITYVSMQNPFISQGAPQKQAERVLETPARENAPGPARIPPSPAALPNAPLDLGKVQQGQQVVRQFRLANLPAGYGKASSESTWLTAVTENPGTNDLLLKVVAVTGDLPLAAWGEVPNPDWFTMVPDPFRSWLGFHSRLFIPRPRKHQGSIYLYKTGDTASQFEVSVEVQPPTWILVFGWLVVIGLMSMEVFLFTGCLVLILLIIL
jgi:serine/threonine protein kinase